MSDSDIEKAGNRGEEYDGEVIDRLPDGGVVLIGILAPRPPAIGRPHQWDYAQGCVIGIGVSTPATRALGGGCYAECEMCGVMAGHNYDDPAQLSWTMQAANAWADEHNHVEHPEMFAQIEWCD